MTEQQLQLALAKELPELISIIEPTDSGCHFETYFHWRDTDLALVTPREWDWIVWKCMQRMTTYQWMEYWKQNQSLDADKTWQERAENYFKAIADAAR